ncbi:MAG: SDR family oxidoreductase [Rhodospirillum sp.]|nr:SDR family oxidoreductase [Rhodospirillum sp.]MCF8491852.1 SDR family oxidoreductase [Rhodospirillum sp.]MCF8501147.1 SDR family oxidoreductase [Rhodospirillum sp.]
MTKAILITGASRGIGRATAIGAARRGWSVAVNYQGDAAAAEDTVAACEAEGVLAIAIRADVSREDEVLALFDQAEGRLGSLNGVVLNAGVVAPAAALADYTLERMQRVFGINTLGAFLCAREAARRLKAGGAIVAVSSSAVRIGSPNEYIDYAASKAAVDCLVLGLSKELAPRNIRVNAVRPGLVETDIHASGGRPDRVAAMSSLIPMGRAGLPGEIAPAILWLLSDEASYTTGALLDVSGAR